MNKLVFISIFAFLSLPKLNARDTVPKRICDGDQRVASASPVVMRVRRELHPDSIETCSAFLIGGNCALSAGHCREILKWVEFSPPASQGFKPQPAEPQNTYQIDPKSIVYESDGGGDDYAVFKLKPNSQTGLSAEQAQGEHLNISQTRPQKIEPMQVIGFGSTKDPFTNLTQKESFGEIKAAVTIKGILWQKNKSILTYNADTMMGDSGAPVLNEDGDVIGIHTNGPCRPFTGRYNTATMINGHKKLNQAINACLER